MSPMSVTSTLEPGSGKLQATTGISLLADGNFEAAVAALRLAVALGDPRPSTLLNLAIAEDRTGNRDRARSLMQTVAVRLPDWDEPVLRLAESLRADNDMAAAEEAYRHVLVLNDRRPEALIALGGLLLARGEAGESRDLLERCCGAAPDNAEAWNTLGLALRATGAAIPALAAFVNAQRLQPNVVAYVLNGVDAATEAKQAEAELARLQEACDQDPLNPVVQAGRGVLLERLGCRDEALDALETATNLAPDTPVLLKLLGIALVRSSQIVQAEAVLRRVTALEPTNSQARNDHAVVLMRLHRHAEARAILLELEQRQGDDISALCNLANATVCVGLQDEAVAVARRAIRLDPVGLLPRRALCNTLPYQHGTTGLDMLSALRDCAAALPRTDQPAFANTPDPDRRLTVGLLSGTLRSHPVGWLTVAGIEVLDPSHFDIVCLAHITALNDPIARRYRTVAREWVDVGAMTDAALTTTARRLGVDILIDLGGYGDAGRMPACANRLAPVQIKWVGLQTHSTGLPEIDWFLTDRWETPSGFEALYTERLLRMPDGYVCYSPPPHAPDVVSLPALKNGHVTFGCFNNLAKITPRVLETWSRILHRVPTARLILKTHQLSDSRTREILLDSFRAHGIDARRIEMRGSSGHRAFMGEYGDVDIVLDPFPYSGGLTTCEALWMGVPTITLPGELFAARHSVSHLSNAGLGDWVTGSTESYIEMAVARAGNVAALAELRQGLREIVRQSPLCDAPRFGRNLGEALRHAWRAWCEAP